MKSLYSLILLVSFTSVYAQNWQQIPMVSQQILDNGHKGGEGCQWPLALSMSDDASLMLFGTDVGGLYKSLDEGEYWEPANTGYNARGTCAFAIDPFNSSRALAVGANSIALSTYHGVYLTTDKATTWNHVLKANNLSYRDRRDQIAFDPASYDAGLGYCTDAYWITDDETTIPSAGLFKSTDGGQNWFKLSGQFVHAILKISMNGTIYVGNAQGLFRSTNNGNSFTQVHYGAVTGIDLFKNNPSRVFFCGAGNVYSSWDQGTTKTTITPNGLNNADLNRITVSPHNPMEMVLQTGSQWQWPTQARRFYTSDGGYNWTEAGLDLTNSFMYHSLRDQDFQWHPTKPNEVWTLGGDMILKSFDKGHNWEWKSSGYSAMLIGGSFAFNVNDPDLMYVGSQDYNGTVTKDGGKTWEVIDLYGSVWGGFIYGGYALNQQVYYGARATCWTCPRKIAITYDAGATYNHTNITLNGLDFSYGSPTNSNIAFCSNHRTTDGGYNWSPMNNCKAVATHNRSNINELIGISDNRIVVSTNQGQWWNNVYTHSNPIVDVAHDHINDIFYFVSNDALFSYNRSTNSFTDLTYKTPGDQYGWRRFKTVAVDPVETNIIYAGSKRDIYKTESAFVRSLDYGQTWELLNHNVLTGQSYSGLAGGQEVKYIRVHPQTREAWVSTSTFGNWKISPPCADVSLSVKVGLEGCMDVSTGQMSSNLRGFDLLPDIQPYGVAPWNYNGTEGQGWTMADYPVGAIDWVLVSFRTGLDKSTEVARTAAVVLEDGTLDFVDPRALSGCSGSSFYIKIQHRNHLSVLSPVPVDILNGTLTFDFTVQDSYLAGAAQKELFPGKWVMYSGDGDQLSTPIGQDINGGDNTLWLPNNGLFNLYSEWDYNLDGDVNGNDKLLWNVNNGVFSTLD